MRIGDLNKQISIIGTTRIPDGMGGFTETDTTIASGIWAAIWPATGSEAIQAMQPFMTVTGRIRIRYRREMLASYRIKYGNRYFAIVSIINPNEKNEWIDLIVKEAA